MSHFSIPANFQSSTIEGISKLNKKWTYPVKEVYGSLNPSLFGSGRSDSLLGQISFNDLEKYIEFCKLNEIEFNYTLNFSCDANLEFSRSGKEKIIKYLKKLDSLGVRRYTVVLPSMMDLLNEYVPDAKISVSVIADVDSLTRLREFMSPKNVDKIMIPEFMNRKISQLERLISNGKKLGVKFGTIVNSTCLIDCPFRNFHYIFSSHSSGGKQYEPIDYWGTRCTLTKLKNPEEILKIGWIRPEDLEKYASMGIEVFKVAGREKLKADFIKTVDIYNQGSFDGNLWELLKSFSDPTGSSDRMFELQNKNLGQFTQRFFEAKSFCSAKNCDSCNYCSSNANLVQVNDADKWKSTLQSEYTSFIKKSTKINFSKAIKSYIH